MQVHQLGNDRQYGHFPHDGGIPFAANGYGELPIWGLFDMHFGRIELVTAQESEVPLGQIIHAMLHKGYLFFGYSHVLHQVNLLFHLLGKAFGVHGVVAIEEGVFYFGARIGLQDVVLATESVGIVVGKVVDDWLHKYRFLWVFISECGGCCVGGVKEIK